MKMKKYNAPSIAEAMKLIRADLGEDAVILNSRVVVKKKFLGLVKQKSFEVVAGVDHAEQRVAPLPPSVRDIFEAPAQPPVAEPAPIVQATTEKPAAKPSVEQDDTLQKDIADLKQMMQAMQRQAVQAQYPEQFVAFLDVLKSQELDEELITAISDELFQHYEEKGEELTDVEMRQIAENYLRQLLEPLPISGLNYDKKYINVLGPTGVGKTTTIAKMAARAVLEKKKKIGFITTDTYRIAAIEQLKTYAGLLQAPVEIVYNADDYKQAIEKLAHLDLIFIDTAGRNYKEAKYVNDLRNLINFDEDMESYLVLSLTTKEKDLKLIVEQFATLAIEKFIFTKLDETNSVGTMFNLMIKYNKGLAYYTNGQEVPEDIEQPSIDTLFDLLFQGEFK